jgi:hypothetical protein
MCASVKESRVFEITSPHNMHVVRKGMDRVLGFV